MSSDAIVLPEKTCAKTAEELVAAATSHSGEGAFEIDGSAVASIDGPAVLAILTVAQALSEKDVTVAVTKPSAAFVDAFTDLGLYEDFMKMELRQ